MPNAASHSRVALSSIASNTGASSPGEELMTCNTSAVAVCCSSASRVSVKSRVFRYGAPDVKIVSVGVIRAGTTIDPGAPSLELEGVEQGRGLLKAGFDLTKMAEAGAYVVTVVVTGTLKAAGGAPGPSVSPVRAPAPPAPASSSPGAVRPLPLQGAANRTPQGTPLPTPTLPAPPPPPPSPPPAPPPTSP